MNDNPNDRDEDQSPGRKLERLARLAREAEAEPLAREADALATRVAEGGFHVACVGQFKRGKSTLVNALVGEPVLPAGVVPVTTVVTVVRHGPRGARVLIEGMPWQEVALDALGGFVAEEENPDNVKRVLAVEVSLPSERLAGGLRLVDTPGVGSIFEAASKATLAFVPQIDAAIVVLGCDPPISAAEVDLVREVARDISTLVVVLNKADRVGATDREEARRFTARTLERALGRSVEPILEVSALSELEDPTDSSPGFEALTATLEGWASGGGAALAREAGGRGLRRLARTLGTALRERRDALLRPREESERRLVELEAAIGDAERSLAELDLRFKAEQRRLEAELVARREAFLAEAEPAARSALRQQLQDHEGGAPSHGEAIAMARALARELVERWRRGEEPVIEGMYRQCVAGFAEMADRHLAAIASSTPALAPSAGLEPDPGFRTETRLYYIDLLPQARRSLLAWTLDGLLPRSARAASIETRAITHLERLLHANAVRVKVDFAERVLESRRRLELELRGHLSGALERARDALERAAQRWTEGADAVREEQERVEAWLAEAEALAS